MNYSYKTGVSAETLGKILLVLLGLVIGTSLGFWVAVRTIPLPSQEIIYRSYNDNSR